jgi:hypothetical protein
MADGKSAIVLADDLRSFVGCRPAEVARTTSAVVSDSSTAPSHWLNALWLDHDLG